MKTIIYTGIFFLLAHMNVRAENGPGLGNLTYSTNEHYKQVSLLESDLGHGRIAMVNGYLMVLYSSDGGGNYQDGGIEFWDVSDPRAPVLKYSYDNDDTHWLKEPHGFALSRSYTIDGSPRDLLIMTAMKGAQIWDVTDPANVTMAKNIQIPEITKSGYLGSWSLAWQPPYLYLGATDLGIIVVKIDDNLDYEHVKTLSPSEMGNTNMGMPHAIGNLLIGTVPASNQGASLNISNPENPLLIESFNTAAGYSSTFSSGYLFTSNLSGGSVTAHRITHDGVLADTFSTSRLINNRGGYGTYQDGYFFSGVSTGAVKYDLARGAAVGEAMTTRMYKRDEDFAEVLGNLVFAGNDHNGGSGLFVHDTQPDTLPPKVDWMHPASGSNSLPLTSRIGLSMSDSVDFSSVNQNTFAVIADDSNQPIAGKYSVKAGIVNFTPNEALQPNTRYTVIVEGIKDYVGNPSPRFEATLTTGNGGSLSHTGSILDILSPSSADDSQRVAVSEEVYVDRNYVFKSVPQYLNGATLVKTRNGDKANSNTEYLSLSMNRATDFYVMFDARATSLPTWLDESYTKLSDHVSFGITDGSTWNFNIYHKALNSGNVSLGGALNGGSNGSSTNYIVAAKAREVPIDLPLCTINEVAPIQVNSTASFASHVTSTQSVEYAWSFGDGTAQTPMDANSASMTHAYSEAGRYPIKLSVRNDAGLTNCSAIQVVYGEPTAYAPTQSATIIEAKVSGAMSSAIVKVNPDNNSVTSLSKITGQSLWETKVGEKPVSIIQTSSGQLWVLNRLSATISRINPTTGLKDDDIMLPDQTLPAALVRIPQSEEVLVSLQGTGELLRLNASGVIVDRQPVIKSARALAVDGNGEYAYVTQFISDDDAGRVAKVQVNDLEKVEVITLAFDPTPDTEASGRGLPNYLSSISINPQGTELFVSSLKANIARGEFRDGQPLDFQNTVRSIVSVIDLATGEENLSRRIDFDNRELPSYVTHSQYGDVYFVSFQGNNIVEARDSKTHALISTADTQEAPQGLVLTGNTRLFTHNFLGRSSTAVDIAGLLSGQSNAMYELYHASTVTSETLSDPVLEGKKSFYSSDLRFALDGYVSCASCHFEGRNDGRTWDMTQIGEGLRNTPSLLGRAGMKHGLLHWTANFDEVQDFENQIREVFSGTGLMSDADYQRSKEPLGSVVKAGLSQDLDNLAAYVASLTNAPMSPYRVNRNLTEVAMAGKALFDSRGCVNCHSGTDFRDGKKHDVGTINEGSGLGIGASLEGVGFDTPTLLGVWNTAPYFHDGSAATLEDTLTESHTGQAFSEAEKGQIAEYLKQIEQERGLSVNSNLNYKWVTSTATNTRLYTDRKYVWRQLPEFLTGVPYLQTANADKSNTSNNLLNFSVEEDSWVWVAFDARTTNVPSWLLDSAWEKYPSTQIDIDNTFFFDLYRMKANARDRVTLGGAASNTNYGVFLTRRELSVANLNEYLTVDSTLNYQWVSSTATNTKLYTDRNYVWRQLPAFLTGVPYLQTANGDKARTNNNLVNFSVDVDGWVWVAFDARTTNVPSWLLDSAWEKYSSTQIDINNTFFFDLYRMHVNAGEHVTLGGAASTANYGVFIT
ncbi:PKD domain-containing protein [Vibrio sp. S9_S30]|uniref:Ig-like domain-containing protein n=1 Tax=Vibrio sp. S9_S30 TaxID=2720226 RepID=UPI001681753B|nr:Ig-like domain-containing protein [Vibrio sp. S9_S30]MBD1557800.1 PKD domain-containing protein [Vibrio sp. S9_S30]